MFNAIIYFTDGTHIIIPSVSSYSWGKVEGAVTVLVDKKRIFFNISHIKCIGLADEMGPIKLTEVFYDE